MHANYCLHVHCGHFEYCSKRTDDRLAAAWTASRSPRPIFMIMPTANYFLYVIYINICIYRYMRQILSAPGCARC